MQVRELDDETYTLLRTRAAAENLAEQLGIPLITCDARLAHSNGHHAEIELYVTNRAGPGAVLPARPRG